MKASGDLLASGVRSRRLTCTIEDVGMNESNLRGSEVLREGRHAKLAPRAAPHDFLKHLVRWLFCITQVRHRAAAHHVSAVAAAAIHGEKYATLFNFRPGSRKFESRHRNRQNFSHKRSERR